MMQFEDRKVAPCWEVDEDRLAGALDCIIPELQPDSVAVHPNVGANILVDARLPVGSYCLLAFVVRSRRARTEAKSESTDP